MDRRNNSYFHNFLIIFAQHCRSSSFDFHKNNENTHCFASPIKHSNYYLSRRHVNSGSVYSGINSASRHSDLPPATIRLYNQLQKVNFVSSSENRISGINNRFLMTLGQEKISQFSEHDSDGPNTSNREVRVNCSGSSTSETSSASFAKTTNQSVQGNPILPNKNCFGQKFSDRVALMDKEPVTFQWEITTPSICRHVHDNTCLPGRVGCILPRPINRGSMVKSGTKITHQCSAFKQ